MTSKNVPADLLARLDQTELIYFICTDLKGCYTYLNSHFCRRFQLDPEAMIGKNSVDSIISEDHPKCLHTIKNCLRHPGQSFFATLRKPVSNDKGWITNFWEFRAIPNAAGEPEEIQCIGYDISEQTRVQKEAAYKSQLLDTIGQAAIAIDLDGTVRYWNQAAVDIYGYSREEMLGQNMSITVHEADPAQMKEAREALMRGESWAGEQIHRTRDGRLFPVIVVDSPIVDETGSIVGMLATSQDISRIKAYQEELKQRQQQLLKLTEKVPGAVYQMHYSADGHIHFPFVSSGIKALQPFLGPEDLKEDGTVVFQYAHPDDLHKVLQVIEQAVQGNYDDIRIEYRIKQGENNYRWNRAIAKPEPTGDGGITWHGIFEDIDAEKKAKEERNQLLEKMTEQNKRLKDFSFMLSHNIRSSTANLQGLLQMLRFEPGNTDYLDLFETTVNNLNRTLSNVNALLNFENNINLQDKVPCSVSEAIGRILDLHKQVLQKKEIRFDLQIAEGLTVPAIPAYFDSVLHNLITNAIKYGITAEERTIIIRGVTEAGKIHISVIDKGPGIDLDRHRDKLFKLGSRLNNEQEGQGLGLFMTKHQLEAMGGQITVESELGKGTTFTISFLA